MYVANLAADNETIIDSKSNSVAGYVSIQGYHGFGLITYDWANGDLYFASYGNNSVVVVNGSVGSHSGYGITNNMTGSIAISYASSALGYYPVDQSVWVGTNATGGILSIISGPSNTVSNIHLHFAPVAFAYDPANKEMYVVSLPNEILGLSYGC
jgi:DNA-binding beta-propeller fold protein YncE